MPTAGRIAGGAIVEREIGFQLANMAEMRLTLRNPDFTTARRIADVDQRRLPRHAPSAENPHHRRPARRRRARTWSASSAAIENLPVEPDTPAKVVIDEVAGVIVMGEDVRISTVAIAQGNLTISVQETPAVSQPGALQPAARPRWSPQSDVTVEEETGTQLDRAERRRLAVHPGQRA